MLENSDNVSVAMIKSVLIVGAGSFVGGAGRYMVSQYMQKVVGAGFPWGTLVVNLLGCFAFGLLFAYFGRAGWLQHSGYLLLTTGFCGGFTTFSTFAHESMQMLQGGEVWSFVGYVLGSVLLGILMVALGYYIIWYNR